MMKKTAIFCILVSMLVPMAAIGAGPLRMHPYPFTGKWQPSEDPLLINENGFSDIQNVRRDGMRYKGISGHTAINTNPIVVGTESTIRPRNAFQFRKDQPQENHLLVDVYESGDGSANVWQNTTAIPSAGEYSATSVIEAEPSALVSRFAIAPQGNVVIANGAESLIWGGNELGINSFITSSAVITNTVTNARDYSEQVLNTSQDADQVAVIGGGNDTDTKILLHMDGADAGTTFTDSASGGKTQTAVGNAQLDTAQKKFGTASVLLDGTGDYVTSPDNADFNFSTGKFCVDFWVRFATSTGQHGLYSQTASATSFFQVIADLDMDRLIFIAHSTTRLNTIWATWNPTQNTWYHVALIRGWGGAANDWALCVDGTALSTWTDSSTMPDVAAVASIGRADPTYAVDLSGWGHAITYNGSMATSRTAYKFGNAAAYFDGTDDRVTSPGTSDVFDIANTTDWSFDCFVKFADHTGAETIASQYVDASNSWVLTHTDGAGFTFVLETLNVSRVTLAAAGEITDTDWHHVALIKVGSDYGLYVDGAQVSHTSVASAYNIAGTFNLGVTTATTNPYAGYIDNVRIKGSNTLFSAAPDAGLTDTITVPAAAEAADIDLYINFDIYELNGWLDEFRVSKGVSRWEAAFSPLTIAYTDPANYGLIGVTRPAQGFKFYVSEPNSTGYAVTMKEWTGSSWSDLSVADGTSGLSSTGSVTFSSTAATSKPKYLEGNLLYWYQFAISGGGATVYHVTVDSPVQNVVNIWDGSEVAVGSCQKWNGTTYDDYTDESNDEDPLTPVVLDSLGTAHYLLVGFTSPAQGLVLNIAAGKGNASAATMTVSYWDGSSWSAATSMNDGTLQGTASLAKTGVVTWEEIDLGQEFITQIADEVPLYFYKLSFSGALDAETEIYYITGIPATKDIPGYRFPGFFQNRSWLFNEYGQRRNMARYSVSNSPDIWNGDDSGVLYFGGETDLTAATTIYNVYQTTGYEQLIVTKADETYRVLGSGPGDWQVQQVSSNIGCVAPLSIAVCEIAGGDAGEKRHVAIWQAAHGIVMCDGATIQTISDDVDVYWDRNDSRAIPLARIDDSFGWYDPNLGVYKLLISSGSDATAAHNVELEYSLKAAEWTKIYRHHGATAVPYQAAAVVRDTTGNAYSYGIANGGYTYRSENGQTFAGNGIAQYITTKDIMLDQENPFFNETTLEYIRLAYKQKTTTGQDISITHWCNGTASVDGTSDQDIPSDFDMDSGPVETKDCFLGPCFSHRIKLSATTTTAVDGMELLGLGLYYDTLNAINTSH